MINIIEVIEKALAESKATIEFQKWQIQSLTKQLEEAEKEIKLLKGGYPNEF